VTSAAFQSAVAQLITSRAIRLNAALGATLPGLSEAEAGQIRRLAQDPGLSVTAQLVSSFRLGKLLSLLPMTRAVLGNERLAAEVTVFWESCPPVSFYPPDEALAFCDHLEARIAAADLADPHLARTVAYERAEILRRRPRPSSSQETDS
jgi:hypothetical protein